MACHQPLDIDDLQTSRLILARLFSKFKLPKVSYMENSKVQLHLSATYSALIIQLIQVYNLDLTEEKQTMH